MWGRSFPGVYHHPQVEHWGTHLHFHPFLHPYLSYTTKSYKSFFPKHHFFLVLCRKPLFRPLFSLEFASWFILFSSQHTFARHSCLHYRIVSSLILLGRTQVPELEERNHSTTIAPLELSRVSSICPRSCGDLNSWQFLHTWDCLTRNFHTDVFFLLSRRLFPPFPIFC